MYKITVIKLEDGVPKLPSEIGSCIKAEDTIYEQIVETLDLKNVIGAVNDLKKDMY